MKFNRNFSIIVLYNDKNEVFIQDRRSISKEWEEWWIFWGWLEKWEDFEEALIRETQEELSIDITWCYKYIWKVLLELDWLWTQETRIYLVKYDPIYFSNLNIKEWDWWKFILLDDIVSMKTTSWVQICFTMLKKYFKENM